MAEPTKKTRQPSALKRDLQSQKKRARNRAHKSKVQTAIRSLKEGVTKKDSKESLQEKLNQVYSLMDKGVKKGVFKANKASRTKARLAATL
jgi:small subunit ribosomal protein S20